MLKVSVLEGGAFVANCLRELSTFSVVSPDEMCVSVFVSCFWLFVPQEEIINAISRKRFSVGCIKMAYNVYRLGKGSVSGFTSAYICTEA